MLLEMLSDFLEARPGLTLTFRHEQGAVRILAMRPPGEFSSARFLQWAEADPRMGELTRALSEIAEALEEHDRLYPVENTVAA